MNSRERHLEVLLFGKPDRIPFVPGGGRESTFKVWRQQGLPEGVDWFPYMCQQIGVELPGPSITVHPTIHFEMIPQFDQKVLERKDGSIVVQDWKGNVCEISDRYDPSYCGGVGGKCDFVTRKWLKCPVESWADWEAMKPRYKANDPARFGPDIDEAARQVRNRTDFYGFGISGVFWQLREWMGFEGLCMAFLDKPDLVRDMVSFWEQHVLGMLERTFRHFVPDYVHISEDMAYKEKAMISPEMIREFILPTWKRWGDFIHKAGCPIYDVDSDGFVGELIPLWIEAGFQVNDPLEVAAGNDLPAFRKAYGTKMAYRGGIDKRAMAKGGRVLQDELDRLTPVIRAGGYIPGCDHGVPPDVSWPNMLDYCRRLARLTGWL